jgi:hypothetical protein
MAGIGKDDVVFDVGAVSGSTIHSSRRSRLAEADVCVFGVCVHRRAWV